MRNFFVTGIIALACVPMVWARETLVPDPSVVIETGMISASALLASPGGEVFIEFSPETKFVHEEGMISFNGEILPPAIIELPDKRPKLRMDPLLSFELISNSGEPILFVDRFDTQNARTILRDTYLNPESINRSSWVKLIIPIENPAVGRPQLWEYIGPTEGWAVIGGILDEPSPEGVRIFSVILRRTGVYTVFDEDPVPTHTQSELIDLGYNENLYEETIPDELFWNESGGSLPEGIFDPNLTSNEAEIPSVANPSPTDTEREELEREKEALLSQITQEADPQNFRVLQERLELLTEKIEILAQKIALEEQRTAAERALLAATTEEERALFTDQINLINTQLSGLDTSEIDAQLSETEGTLSDRLNEESSPSLSPSKAENTDNSFPQNASLPKTGIEDGNNGESFSLFFPTLLGLVLIVIIASSMVAAHKRN